MKTLLRISLDRALLSFIPVLTWFILGILVDPDLLNIFTLTYPLQFIYYIIVSVFSVGANISKHRDHNQNAPMSGLLLGSIVTLLIFLPIIFNVDHYIAYMHMDTSTYHAFAIYAIAQILISTIFMMVLNKLYFEDKNRLANYYSIAFNSLSLVVVVAMILLTHNHTLSINTSLLTLTLFTLYICLKHSQKFKFQLNLKNCLRYDAVEFSSNVLFFIIFLIGLREVFSFGEEFALALTFATLLTDTQWDALSAIDILAKIDISKNRFNYKIHLRNAYRLLALLGIFTVILFVLLYPFYNLNLGIVLLYIACDVADFIVCPVYRLKNYYLQLEWSATKTAANRLCGLSLRSFCSLMIKNPFNTAIGQIVSSFYQLITINLLLRQKYIISRTGKIIPRKQIPEQTTDAITV